MRRGHHWSGPPRHPSTRSAPRRPHAAAHRIFHWGTSRRTTTETKHRPANNVCSPPRGTPRPLAARDLPRLGPHAAQSPATFKEIAQRGDFSSGRPRLQPTVREKGCTCFRKCTPTQTRRGAYGAGPPGPPPPHFGIARDRGPDQADHTLGNFQPQGRGGAGTGRRHGRSRPKPQNDCSQTRRVALLGTPWRRRRCDPFIFSPSRHRPPRRLGAIALASPRDRPHPAPNPIPAAAGWQNLAPRTTFYAVGQKRPQAAYF